MKRYQAKTHNRERGEISAAQVTIVGLVILVLGLGSFGIWSFVNYTDARDDVDSKIAVAVAEAKKEEAEKQTQYFAEREKEPNRTFTGPENYCSVSFDYPKTWSAFESKSVVNGGDYEAYLHPYLIPPLGSDQQYALRVKIEQKDYDQVVQSYDSLVRKGDLKQSTTTSEGKQGVRLSGNFSKNIRGDAVIYKCLDKTITIRTDVPSGNSLHSDYETLIKTLDFNA